MSAAARFPAWAFVLFAGAFLWLSLATPALAQKAATERNFQAWLAGDLWRTAKGVGVSRRAFEQALSGVSLDWSLPDLVPPGSKGAVPRAQQQAEFRAPGRYFSESRIKGLVGQGRRELARWKQSLDAIEARYGVQRRIIVAIWGRESDYGRAALPHRAVRALATEAFIGRRKAHFQTELIAALQIIQAGHISAKQMRSSWAGGLGHPQFLPSSFLEFAVDFDGDGRRDIWNSVPDALASIANYLKAHGWQSGRDWGYEAVVPTNVPCTLAGPEQGRPIAQWAGAGVVRVAGRQWPGHELPQTGYLLFPAGRYGPAWVTTPNFYVLKEYNESDLYALFIGHLADRYGRDRKFVGGWSKVGGFNRADVQAMQKRLEKRGLDVGGADGLIGFKTRIAVGTVQAKSGRPVTCFPDRAFIGALR
ncbi:MAG: lytic murein transglycosylase [Alphaproteobacteria bacterium]